MLLINADLISQSQCSKGYYLLEFYAPQLAKLTQPGQFVHVKCSDSTDPLLRRPISIHRVNREKGTVSLLYRVVGKGTLLLSQLQAGQRLSVMGPLGKGFKLPEKGRRVAVVAGGIGIAPLYLLIKELLDLGFEPEVFIGARNADHLPVVEDIRAMGLEVKVATDDGDLGHRGPITQLLNRTIENKGQGCFDIIYTCGPVPMMKAVAKIAEQNGIVAQVSLEEKMGCGVGACLACTCKVKIAGDRAVTLKRVCADGPVFDAGEVVWDD
ncbi:dihydroorotate dehydrogenase electron transfer subunit [Desulfofalx alkaliphila]|uniref:dihydroorotate dehydrogenase electron transfer subunit n=1 Tax=Desulfofalx alkaliphila TaxID=105483 RepID=UPI0004E1A462|nr:dihydroorotate dehydrogenase electron transfer subunit [Desulfofalx alkaliphila]